MVYQVVQSLLVYLYELIVNMVEFLLLVSRTCNHYQISAYFQLVLIFQHRCSETRSSLGFNTTFTKSNRYSAKLVRFSLNIGLLFGKNVGKHLASFPFSITTLTRLLPSHGATQNISSKYCSRISWPMSAGCIQLSSCTPHNRSSSVIASLFSSYVTFSATSFVLVSSFDTSGEGLTQSCSDTMSLYHLLFSFKYCNTS